MTPPRATTLRDALGVAMTAVHSQHPDMAVLGPQAWGALHQWAENFRSQVGDSCGCGEFAVRLASFAHDLVSVSLGKQPYDPSNFVGMSQYLATVLEEWYNRKEPSVTGSLSSRAENRNQDGFVWQEGAHGISGHITSFTEKLTPRKSGYETMPGTSPIESAWDTPQGALLMVRQSEKNNGQDIKNGVTPTRRLSEGTTKNPYLSQVQKSKVDRTQRPTERTILNGHEHNGPSANPTRSGMRFGRNSFPDTKVSVSTAEVKHGSPQTISFLSVVEGKPSPQTLSSPASPATPESIMGLSLNPSNLASDMTDVHQDPIAVLVQDLSAPFAMTREIAWAAATDAANKAMRKAGRGKWSLADYNLAVRTFNKFWPSEEDAAMAEGVGIYPFDPAEYDDDDEEEEHDGPTIRHRKPRIKFKPKPKLRKGRKPVTKGQASMGVATMEPSDKRPPKAWWDSCIRGVEGEDPAAVCGRVWTRISPKVKARIRRQGEAFHARQMGEAPPTLSNAFWNMVLGTAGQAAIATLASTLVARALGGIAVTGSPQAGIKVIDDRASRCKDDEEWDGALCKPKKVGVTGSLGVVSPAHVQGDQAQVDVGTLLEEVDAIMRDPSKMGKVNVDTLKVIRG